MSETGQKGFSGINRAKLNIQNYINKIDNLRPVFDKFIKHYQDLLKFNISRNGVVFGSVWQKYSPVYAKWKLENKDKYPRSSGGRKMMILSGALFDASQGGSGWFQKIDKKSLRFGITNIIPYAEIQQKGGISPEGWEIPQRPWFFNKDNKSIPNASILFLERTLKEEFKRVAIIG